MLSYLNKKRVLNNFKEMFIKRPNLSKAAKEWIAAFSTLTDEDQLQLITQFERSQSLTIVKGITAKDRNIHVPALGTFKINDIREMFVDRKEELSGTTKEERLDMMRKEFGYKFNK